MVLNLTTETGFKWNEKLQRYQGPGGRIVSMSQVREGIDAVIDAEKAKLRELSQSLVDGKLSVAEWQSSFAQEIKNLHVASAAAARGGWGQMSAADWGWTGQQIKGEYGYLRNFAKQIADGTQPLDGRVLFRSDLYAQSGRGTYEDFRRRHLNETREVVGEIRVLGVADHCTSTGGVEGCLELAGLGVQPVGTLPPIGAAVCGPNCHCHFEYELADGTRML